jgi:hypothetical protein
MTGRGQAAAVAIALAAIATGVPGAIAKARPPKTRPPEIRYTFADIDWFTPGTRALTRLGEKGYRTIPGTHEAVVAQGRAFDHLAVARGMLDDSARVVRWEVTLLADSKEDQYREMRPVYDQIVTECVQRYGRAWDQVEKYKFPYDKADGRETSALHDEKAMIRTRWRGNHTGDRLEVQMNKDANVLLTYSCTGWQDFQDRVRHRKARDF